MENNANVNVKGFKESTPLHEAVLNNHLDCAQYLLDNGADATIRNSHGFLAKDFIKNCKNSCDFIKLFEKMEYKIVQKIEKLNLPELPNTTKTRLKRGTKPKSITIYSTGMTEDEKGKISETAKKLNFKFVREMSPNGYFYENNNRL